MAGQEDGGAQLLRELADISVKANITRPVQKTDYYGDYSRNGKHTWDIEALKEDIAILRRRLSLRQRSKTQKLRQTTNLSRSSTADAITKRPSRTRSSLRRSNVQTSARTSSQRSDGKISKTTTAHVTAAVSSRSSRTGTEKVQGDNKINNEVTENAVANAKETDNQSRQPRGRQKKQAVIDVEKPTESEDDSDEQSDEEPLSLRRPRRQVTLRRSTRTRRQPAPHPQPSPSPQQRKPVVRTRARAKAPKRKASSTGRATAKTKTKTATTTAINVPAAQFALQDSLANMLQPASNKRTERRSSATNDHTAAGVAKRTRRSVSRQQQTNTVEDETSSEEEEEEEELAEHEEVDLKRLSGVHQEVYQQFTFLKPLGEEGKDGQTLLCRAKTAARDSSGRTIRKKGSYAAMKVFKPKKSIGFIRNECGLQQKIASFGLAPPIVSTWVSSSRVAVQFKIA